MRGNAHAISSALISLNLRHSRDGDGGNETSRKAWEYSYTLLRSRIYVSPKMKTCDSDIFQRRPLRIFVNAYIIVVERTNERTNEQICT